MLLTVPASFDEEARELTRRAAEQAGYHHVTLLEEPQAAFYAWLESQGDAWRRRIKVGDLVLVCDIGGGTTDFSLIMVSEENGELTLKRVAVGDHILLGGDNMDLALARLLQQRLEASGNRIDTWQFAQPVASVPNRQRKSYSNRPRRRIAQSHCWARGRNSSAAPLRRNCRAKTSIRSWSKDFSQRSRATNYLRASAVLAFRSWACRTRPIPPSPSTSRAFSRSKFVTVPRRRASAAAAADLACPTHILFNGGVMKAAVLRDRVVEVLNSWLRQEGFDALGAGADPRSSRLGARRCARRGLLREGASRSRRAYPQWRLAHLLHRN